MNNLKQHAKNHVPSLFLIGIMMYTLPALIYRKDSISQVFVSTEQGLFFGNSFSEIGIYIIAAIEFLVIVLLILGLMSKKFKFLGGLLSFFVIIGGLYAHLFTPLGIEVDGDRGALFFMTLIGFVCSIFILKKTYKGYLDS